MGVATYVPPSRLELVDILLKDRGVNAYRSYKDSTKQHLKRSHSCKRLVQIHCSEAQSIAQIPGPISSEAKSSSDKTYKATPRVKRTSLKLVKGVECRWALFLVKCVKRRYGSSRPGVRMGAIES
jgi:hypothetical protein